MSTDREIFGEWSASGEAAVEGRMLVDEEGRISLQLRRPLPAGALLHGRLGDGAPATLFGASLLRLDPQGEHYKQELAIGTALLGLDLPDPEQPALATGEARIGGLEQVIGTSGLSLETADISSRANASAKIEWQASEPTAVALAGGTLTLRDYARFEHDSYYRYVLEHRALAGFVAEEPTSLEEFESVFDVLTAFLAFATEARVSLGSLSLTAADAEPGAERAELLAHHRPRYGRGPEEIDPWLTLDALSDPAGALAGFYRFHAEQPSAYLILFEYLVFAAQLNPIDKLLYLARFLEVYHRTRFGSDGMAFLERVVELLAGPAAVVAPVFGVDPEDLATLLRDCRNYWTHYDPKLAKRALYDIPLDDFDDRLLLIVRACVLDHLDVPASEAQRCLEADWRWQQRATTPLEQPK